MDSFSGLDMDVKNYNIANLRLSTSFRTNQSEPDTNCTIQLNQNRMTTNVVKLDVNYFSVSNVFFNVASYNNKFELSIYDINIGPPVSQYSVEITAGYYNATQLAAKIQAVLRALDTRLQALKFVYDTNSKRFATSTEAFQYYCDMEAYRGNLNRIGNNFLWLIGANTSTNVYRIGVNTTETPFPTNLQGASTVYLCSRKLATTKSIQELIDNGNSVTSTVANEVMSVGIDSEYGFQTTYYNNGSSRGMYTYSSGFILDQIDIQLRDEWNNILESDRPNNPIHVGVRLFYI